MESLLLRVPLSLYQEEKDFTSLEALNGKASFDIIFIYYLSWSFPITSCNWPLQAFLCPFKDGT